jgi:alpha-amylase
MKKIILLFTIIAFGFSFQSGGDKEKNKIQLQSFPKSDVFMQGFYWNSPPGGIWYDSLSNIAARLASAGFGALWIPPASKGGGGLSMGYDVYDYYDFGNYNQKGSIETRFGSRTEMENMVQIFQSVGVELFYDAVINHSGNADQQAPYQCGTGSGYVIFNPLSGRFQRTAANFHPNNIHCDNNAPYHNKIFFEDLCHYSAGTKDSLIVWMDYVINDLHFNGFRIDAIKHIEPQIIAQITQAFPGIYMVGEHWSGVGEIIDYYNQVVSNGGNVSLFDFPLRYVLKDMCNNTSGSFNMNNLDGAGLINSGMSTFSVSTFVENHDFDRIGWDGTISPGHDPVLFDKPMAYAYIIFSEGRPSVFFKDYFDYGNSGAIDTLIWIRQKFLGGNTTKRGGLNPYYIRQDGNQDQNSLSQDIYVARRNGYQTQPGGYLVINDNPSQWIDIYVDTELPIGTWYKDYTGKDVNKQVLPPGPGGTKNRIKLWAPPRSYTIYVPDTTQQINNPPVLNNVPDQTGYTNSYFKYQLKASDANNDPLNFSVNGKPNWLNLSQSGLLFGTPAFSDTGISTIIVSVSDPAGSVAKDTFNLKVETNFAPTINSISDTTIKATIRYEYQASGSDQDGDTLHYILAQAPGWLNIGEFSGLISGTPSVGDTGVYNIWVKLTDGKGAFDSTDYQLTVIKNTDTLIATYGKPVIDGNISISDSDWLEEWRIVADPDTDSFWHPVDSLDNELMGIFATWDADSLYIGVDYVINDNYNTLMLYIEAGLPGGVTNFNSNSGYVGDYAKNFRFRSNDAIDFFAVAYYLDVPLFYKAESNNSINLSAETNSKRGDNARSSEMAVAWNTLYNLGAGLIPQNVSMKFVAVVAGGFNYGGGDSAPDNPDIDGNAGPDSLINFAAIFPDQDGDGIPDPTIILDVEDESLRKVIPDKFVLMQNYPNPFNPVTNISFDIPERIQVEVKVFDILGREVAVIVDEFMEPGTYRYQFNSYGLPSGIYFFRLSAGSFTDVKKMVLLK